MTRWDYDGVFYRVFCLTLLAIAFTFTVILTNVFIDIDGLLSFRGRAKTNSGPVTQNNPNSLTFNAEPILDRYEDEDKDYEELDDNYRTKRSLESQNVLFHITNPKIKSILTSRLAKLLEKLDEEETTPYIKNDKDTDKSKESIMKMSDVELLDVSNVKKREKNTETITYDNFLHLNMHNIVMQGIIEHMDINEFYKRIHSFMKNFKDSNKLKVDKSEAMKLPLKFKSKGLSANEESIFFNELLNCKQLQDQIMEVTEKYEDKESTRNAAHKGPKVLIKTVIDITSMADNKVNKKNETDSIDNIKGKIKLIYNGKPIKVDQMDDVTTPPMTNTVGITSTNLTQKNATDEKFEGVSDSSEHNKVHARKLFINRIFNNYFKNLHKIDYSESAEMHQIKTKRLKRHVRIRYDNAKITTEKSKIKKNSKDDDELYVEIETHFDSKGMKDEKKKKLIKSLIEKIQKVLNDPVDINKTSDKNKRHKHLHVKKRNQDSLGYSKLSNKNQPEHIDTVIHRQLNPISKTVTSQEDVPNIYDSVGDSWKKTYTGPGFLAASKSINSAERNEVDTQYSKLMNINGIPQRMQRPLNIEGSDEDVGANSYFDLGNLKFIIKEIDGTGFSVGYNQYVDEPPNAETMKLFTGLENIIQTYHQKYDPAVTGPEDSASEKANTLNNNYESPENSKTEHVMVRRSIKGHDYHSNEYKVIFNSDYLPYKNYQEIYDDSKRKVHSVKDYNHKNIKFTLKDMNAPFILDEDVFKKDLKPAEIFGLANLLDRKKRGTKVKQILNLKSKIKMNKYLNTNKMASKKIFLNKKRIKRQLNKIRIIASDSPHQQRQSDENIFFVSDENIFADRAIIREVRPHQIVEDSAGKIEEQHYDVLPPYVYEDSKEPTYITNVFDGKSRHNSLMSKYPHIFLDEISRSKEQYLPDETLMNSKTIPEPPPDIIDTEQTATTQSTEATENYNPQPIVDNVVSEPKSNFKLTVKILPKNISDSNPGFKEVHTSINESYKKNGMMYSSLVNVSEISKIIKLNRTKTRIEVTQLTTISPIILKVVKEQQSKINKLLKQHKYTIDEQLQHLNREKQRLETMLASKKVTLTEGQSNELVDLVLSKDPLKIVRLPKEQITQLALKALSQTQGQYFEANNQVTTAAPTIMSTTDITTSTTTTSTRTTTSPTSTITTTNVPMTTIEISRRSEMIGLDKIKILNTIERNDKLTNQILKKIDKNAEILQIFLTKLLDSIPPKTSISSKDANLPSKINLNESMSSWKDYQPIRDPPYQPPPISDVQKYSTHVSIPFVYAYQQPYHVPDSKLKNPMQSIVYQGHIHTNTITNKANLWNQNDLKPKQPNPVNNSNTKRDVNQTRFFVDEIENDFKIIPLPLQKKTEIFPIHVITTTNDTTH